MLVAVNMPLTTNLFSALSHLIYFSPAAWPKFSVTSASSGFVPVPTVQLAWLVPNAAKGPVLCECSATFDSLPGVA